MSSRLPIGVATTYNVPLFVCSGMVKVFGCGESSGGPMEACWSEFKHSISAKRGRISLAKEMTMKLESLRELFIEELQDLYSAENQILEALPKMIKKTSSPDLKAGFTEHLEQTRQHVSRLDRIFDQLGDDIDADEKTCKGMQGIIKDAEELLKTEADPEVLD